MGTDVLARMQKYEGDLIKFLIDLISIPSPGGEEEQAIQRIGDEMDGLGFDEITVDAMGNIIGRMGSGKRTVAYDGHVDTVDFPLEECRGLFHNGNITGPGAVDQKGGIASMLYGAKVVKDLHWHEGCTLYCVASVHEEKYEGLNWQYMLSQKTMEPEFVVITEPSNLQFCRGNKGRLEMKITTEGISSHASRPQGSDHSLYKMIPILEGIKAMQGKSPHDSLLGSGSIVVTHIENETRSLNSIPWQTRLYIDRRLTSGETREQAQKEIEDLCARVGVQAKVEITSSKVKNYTQLVLDIENYYPAWVLSEDHPLLSAGLKAYETLFAQKARVRGWDFNTNATSIHGMYGIPCLGFGPGDERLAHTVKEQVAVEDLLKAGAVYSRLLYEMGAPC